MFCIHKYIDTPYKMLILHVCYFRYDKWEYILYRYLIEQGCNLAAVNNDGELALDIAESNEMEDMIQQHINKAGLYLYVHPQDIRSLLRKLLIIDLRGRSKLWKS